MNKYAIGTFFLGIVIGAVTYGFIASQKPTQEDQPIAVQSREGHSGMTMEDMVQNLKGKKGDEFDKVFISEMIDHHQGAIDMANLVKDSAKHDELKKLAEDIITAQTTEIEMMRKWQKDWGYTDAHTTH